MEPSAGSGAVAYLGIDVGKRSHSACALDAEGRVAFRCEVANRPADIDRLLDRAGSGALVVVDQKRNIGALVLARAHARGARCAYLPGYAEKRVRDVAPVTAKTDAVDAEVIARTAKGMPWVLRPAAEEPARTAALRALSSQREFAVAERTRAKNRLRAVLLEADPALESAVDPSRRWQMALLARFGGALGCAGATWRSFSSAARAAKAPAAAARRLWEACRASAGEGGLSDAAGRVSGMLAGRISSLDAEVDELDGLMSGALEGDGVYECLLTVPGIGPRTAALLVACVDISLFRGHDELASYCGLAPADSRSGTSVRSVSPQRGGSRQLKNALVYSCVSLIGTPGRFGRYYDECRARGMRHTKALKAVARKRLKVIYAIMRDAVPYAA